MSTSTSPGHPSRQTRDDLLYAMGAAIHLRFDEDTPVEREAVRQALRQQPDRVRLHVDRLLHHVRADPERLAAIPSAAAQRIGELRAKQADPGRMRRCLVAAEMAEQSLARVRQAGAERDVHARRTPRRQRQERLAGQL